MQNIIRSYNATVAKIRAMYGKRITPQDYTELVSRRSVADIAEYLKKVKRQFIYYGKFKISR